jgi:penicillin amidase
LPRIITGALGAIALGAALWIGFMPTGAIPPLGGLLDPWHGVWALARSASPPSMSTAEVPNLTDTVEVRYDDRGVPHVFARNEPDATRALGFVVARDRLFQLELQTRAANGTLTELLGAELLEDDKDTRRIGLPWGARRRAPAADDPCCAAAQAYADGVNAYIAQMPANELPLEYRLLNARPQRWEPDHTALLLVRMGLTLAWSEFELMRDQLVSRIGAEATDALFPRDAYLQEPIQPTAHARDDARRIPPPALSPLAPLAAPVRETASRAELGHASNNWAVSPSRSASGYALLANDPHLDLSLPSTWYEAHLVVPGSLDVYGVTLPGSTAINLGLNRDIAWGSTNVGADVADYYVETVDDSVAPRRYGVDGAWRDVTSAIETYRGRRGESLATDTLYYTHRGSLFRQGARWMSRRWLTLEGPASTAPFENAAHAKSVREFFDAMGPFVSPAQNFVVADRQGHIGIRSTGAYPRRPGNRGDTLFDGSSSASDWTGWTTPAEAPQSIDPRQGYVASANQQPADPRDVRYYLGNEWPAPWRAAHINSLLQRDTAVTADAMRRYQTDAGNARADAFVPLLLDAARTSAGRGASDSVLARAASLLAEWDRRFTLDNERAILFENAMRDLERRTWDELAARPPSVDSLPTRFIALPDEHVLYALTRDPSSAWWDIRTTPGREARDDVLAASLRAGLQRTERDRGPASEGRWKWSGIRYANIWHLLRIPALSALEIPMQGGRASLNPSSGDGSHGASWRLVAEMGPTIRAWGTYPGGQSAHPLSHHYRDRIDGWSRGELDSLRIPATPGELSAAHHASTLILVPARR